MKLVTRVHPTFHYVSIKSGAQTTNTVTEAEGGGAIRFSSILLMTRRRRDGP